MIRPECSQLTDLSVPENLSHLLRDRRDGFSFDDHGHNVSSLLEENARLRALALSLSTMILKFLNQK
jgi:hypothetical protein